MAYFAVKSVSVQIVQMWSSMLEDYRFFDSKLLCVALRPRDVSVQNRTAKKSTAIVSTEGCLAVSIAVVSIVIMGTLDIQLIYFY